MFHRCTEADFVGSVLLKESINSSIGDDDKIYFFFTERSQEQIAYPSQTKVSRIARVCKVRTLTSLITINPNCFNVSPDLENYQLLWLQGHKMKGLNEG